MTRRRTTGDVIFFKKRKIANGWVICLLALYLFQYGAIKISRPWLGGFVVVFCLITLAELMYVILVSVYKPVGMVIADRELVLYDRVISRRNMASLATIKLNDFENSIVLVFERQYRIAILIKEYGMDDLLAFIATATGLSKLQVYVHPGVYKKLQPPPPPQPFFRKIGGVLKDTFLP